MLVPGVVFAFESSAAVGAFGFFAQHVEAPALKVLAALWTHIVVLHILLQLFGLLIGFVSHAHYHAGDTYGKANHHQPYGRLPDAAQESGSE